MTRVLLLGLASLALLVAPVLKAAAQASAGGQSGEAVPWQAEPGAAGSDSIPTARDGMAAGAPGAEASVTGSTADEDSQPVPEHVLDVSGAIPPILDDLAPDAVIVTDGQPMAIEEAVALAIKNGLDVEVQRFGPLIAEASKDAARGFYDPLLYGDAFYDVAKSPNTFRINPVAINRDRTQGGGVGINQLIPYLGASLDARFSSTSLVTRSRIQAFDPQYNSSFTVSATVPLLRNVIWNSTWTNVKLTGFQSEAAELRFRQSLMDTVQFTVNSYWGLVAARDRVRVAQKSLETARALLAQTKTQYEVGVVSQVEVVEAEAGVANREFELIENANSFRNAQDRLIDAVLGPELKARTVLQIVPTADLTSYRLPPVDVEQSVVRAFEKRPELKVAQNAIGQGEVGVKFAKGQRLPQFDVLGRFGYVGISGRGNQGLNPAFGLPPVNQAYGESTDDFFTRKGAENYRVQGVFSVPIPNNTGRSNVSRSEFELRRSRTSLIRLEQSIIVEVRNASRTLLAAAQGIEAAERRRLAAEEQLRAERIRLEHGESTPFEVLQREEDLVEAESQKINALQTFRAAETALERAQGTILEEHEIEVDAVRKPVR